MKHFEVAVIGLGVSGSSAIYTLSQYTNIESIVGIEKYKEPGSVNSNSKFNSQTLHFGDIETNYSLQKAMKVSAAAQMVVNYLKMYGDDGLAEKFPKMVIGVGNEANEIRARYSSMSEIYPKLRLFQRPQIKQIEPHVIRGRKIDEDIAALYSPDGYAVDFGSLSASFLKNQENGKEVELNFATIVNRVDRTANGFRITTDNTEHIEAKAVAFATGAHSLLFAKAMGYGEEYSILPIAGNFFKAKKVLNGKVYTVQNPKLPFAAVHGDPDLNDDGITRFGPTAGYRPMFERGNYGTVLDYLNVINDPISYGKAMWQLIKDKEIRDFITDNLIYDIPISGRKRFADMCRKIIPEITEDDFLPGKVYGGIRPQLIKGGVLYTGEAKIVKPGIIFDITPSPGASDCMENAEANAKTLCNYLGKTFDEMQFNEDFKPDLMRV